ncbi:MAG: hypothetical protein FVQ79_03750 [Planctomycetes bacterium]|nr:hypothetical protein [Planctomycetota bacterium]
MARDSGLSRKILAAGYSRFMAAAKRTIKSEKQEKAITCVRAGREFGHVGKTLSIRKSTVAAWWDDFLNAGRDGLFSATGRLIVIGGGSATGKTTLLNLMRKSRDVNVRRVRKYTTRAARSDEDDIVSMEEATDADHDYVYAWNNNRYGIKARDIRDIISSGETGAVIITPIATVREIKRHFGGLCLYFYMFRGEGFAREQQMRIRQLVEGADRDKLLELLQELDTRAGDLRSIWRNYIENIAFIDHVILNITSEKDALTQVRNIMRAHKGMGPRCRKCHVGKSTFGRRATVFLVAGGPGSGKHTLVEAVKTLGRRRIAVVEKKTEREKQADDGDEIKCIERIDEEECSVTYRYNNRRYGVNTQEMWTTVEAGKAQLLITNMNVMPFFIRMFGPLAVCLYLFRTRNPQDIYENAMTKGMTDSAAKYRAKRASDVHQEYIRNVALIEHVLLNTGNRDDLASQMLNLVDHYDS